MPVYVCTVFPQIQAWASISFSRVLPPGLFMGSASNQGPAFIVIVSVGMRRGPLAQVHPSTQFPTPPIMGVPSPKVHSVLSVGAETTSNSFCDMSCPSVCDPTTLSLPKSMCSNSFCDIFDLRYATVV